MLIFDVRIDINIHLKNHNHILINATTGIRTSCTCMFSVIVHIAMHVSIVMVLVTFTASFQILLSLLLLSYH